jgi:hypothetical protein
MLASLQNVLEKQSLVSNMNLDELHLNMAAVVTEVL